MKFAGLRIFASSGSIGGAEDGEFRLARIFPRPPRPPDGTWVFWEKMPVSIVKTENVENDVETEQSEGRMGGGEP